MPDVVALSGAQFTVEPPERAADRTEQDPRQDQQDRQREGRLESAAPADCRRPLRV